MKKVPLGKIHLEGFIEQRSLVEIVAGGAGLSKRASWDCWNSYKVYGRENTIAGFPDGKLNLLLVYSALQKKLDFFGFSIHKIHTYY